MYKRQDHDYDFYYQCYFAGYEMIRFYNNAYSIGLSAGDSVYVNLYYSAGSNQFRAYFENITTGKVLTEIVTPLDGSCLLYTSRCV